MKKYLIALSALTIITISVNAQTKRNTNETTTAHQYQKDGKKRGHANGMMMKELNLSDAQKEQAKSMRDQYRTQYKQLEAGKANMSQADYEAKKTALRKEQKSKFESILTTEQKSKMADLKSQHMAKKSAMGEKRMGTEKRMDKIKTALNLTDAQVSKLQSQHKTFKSQAMAIKENSSLSQDEKKQQFMELRRKNQENEKNILTAEQLQKKEQLRSSRMKDMKNKRSEKS